MKIQDVSGLFIRWLIADELVIMGELQRDHYSVLFMILVLLQMLILASCVVVLTTVLFIVAASSRFTFVVARSQCGLGWRCRLVVVDDRILYSSSPSRHLSNTSLTQCFSAVVHWLLFRYHSRWATCASPRRFVLDSPVWTV